MATAFETQPLVATTSDTSDPAPVKLETSTSPTGAQVTVIRDAKGNLLYPSHVPPETQSPSFCPAIPPTSQNKKQDQANPIDKVSESPGLRKTHTEPIKRPMNKQWQTEAPTQTNRQDSFAVPAMKRAGTNTSLWDPRALHAFGDNSDSSSESSSDEEEHAPGHKKPLFRKKQADKKQHERHGHFGKFNVGNENYRTKGRVSKRDGRLNISVNDTSSTGYLAKALGMAAKKVMPARGENSNKNAEHIRKSSVVSRLSTASTTAGPDKISCPKLNIVIMVIGSRGDAQPFLKIGKVLKEQYGHRVRIATHPAFRDFVEKDSGLEFFSVGGDPAELMSFMVKNPGMIPTLESVKAGDIGKRRAAMAGMFQGFWRACINATDDERDVHNLKMMGRMDPFVADAIIANPPSFAHIHCAEALGIPVHLMFTFPYTPTQAFPHPLASIKKSNVDPGYTNWISYPLVEMMVWQGLGDLVNDFRVKTLGLDPVSTLWAPGATYRLHVPFSYLWSPGIVAKPEDWGDEIDVSGFVFLELASTFQPPDDLVKFLEAGEAPVYIGFGSIVVDDADRFTQMIFDAVKLAGVRALVSKGWGGLGGDSLDVPENIYMLDNTPHDWLFPRVRACVIHGGAGTTAIALKCGKPTMIVPFFGDQHFWGAMVSNSKAGPEPVPYKSLTAEKLADGIKYCLTDEAVKAVEEIAHRISEEGDGAENACKAFHKGLMLHGDRSMRCSILRDKVAVWQVKGSPTGLKLSAMAADLAVEKRLTSWKNLRLLRHVEWNDFEGPGEPVTGVAGTVVSTVGDVFSGIGGVPIRLGKKAKQRKVKKQEKRERREKKLKAREARLEGKGKAKEKGNSAVNGEKVKKPSEQQNGTIQKVETKDHAAAAAAAADDNKSDARFSGRSSDSKPDDATAVDNNSNETTPDSGQSLPNITTTTTNAIHNTRSRFDSPPPSPSSSPLHAPIRPATDHRTDTNLTTMTTTTNGGESTTDPAEVAEEIVHEIGQGAIKSASAIARAPVDLSIALAQGFHNAPRLYGDDTVRRPTRVTGIKSGLKAAGHEFVFGIYDGWTGLVRLPYRGFKEGGISSKPSGSASRPGTGTGTGSQGGSTANDNNDAGAGSTKPAPAGRMVGLVKGVGMGLTGFVLKDISAIIGPIGYTLKGVVKQAQRGRGPAKYIRKARIVQGARELEAVSPEERRRRMEEVVEGWKILRELWDELQEVERGDKGRKQKTMKNSNSNKQAITNGKATNGTPVVDGVVSNGVKNEKERKDNTMEQKRAQKRWVMARGLGRRRRVAVQGEAFESVEMARKALEELRASSS
ncbi:glycosyltransferase family 1 protein [Neurospora crassa]|uniref:UDP-glucose,sterol transferase n=1 Tax=Neurospora crassa (strain ATCC 24698 / 74-OR23-1A / CBS 708.71 / DSM 1257 / FGSC 987) TaxID=367110 RepID=Q7RZT3_NEUCR|nr:UDP-glucose,sterol transferase [Neurospora crassa OR74A]EAA28516.1 UDP-glucose,sterol transferase [Neurospora crassa OR74A]KHE89622.1 glycosyltransferase family 1 protein [Neurospora crassa]|eukprot:XP_957752.1 UDP-glucose,sterol transferase [Neurospora crassa OR74A]